MTHENVEGFIKLKRENGFGFIHRCDAKEIEGDVFFHANDIVNAEWYEIRPGDRVMIGEVNKKPDGRYEAKKVHLLAD